MPRLHKYRDRDASFVLTAIRGAVVTFQLTTDGEKKLAAARIGPGEKFPRALLLDLYRRGDYEGTRELAAKILAIDPGYEKAAVLQRAAVQLKGSPVPSVSQRQLIEDRLDDGLRLYRQV